MRRRWFLTTCTETGERFFVRRLGRKYVVLLRPDGTEQTIVPRDLASSLCEPCEACDQALADAVERTHKLLFPVKAETPTAPPEPTQWEKRSSILAKCKRAA